MLGACTIFPLICHWPTHPLVRWLVPAAYSWLLRSTDCQHTSSRIANPKHYHLQDVSQSVSSLLLLASTTRTHRCGQACRQELLAFTSHSIWPLLQNGLVPSRPLRVAQLHQRSPCLEDNDITFSQILSLEKCSRPTHCAEPSSPSTHVQDQFLSCISLRRLLEMPAAVPESVKFAHSPRSKFPFELFGVEITTRFVDWHRLIKTFATTRVLGSWSHCNSALTTQPVN